MQKRERKTERERGRDLQLESRQSMTCGQPEGVLKWGKRKRERRSAASFGGTIKCLVNKLRLPFDNMHAASWAQQQQQKRGEAEKERGRRSRWSREKREGGKVISALHRKIDWRPMTQREARERECALKRTLIVCGRWRRRHAKPKRNHKLKLMTLARRSWKLKAERRDTENGRRPCASKTKKKEHECKQEAEEGKEEAVDE